MGGRRADRSGATCRLQGRAYLPAMRYLRRAFAEHPAAWTDPALLLELARTESHVDSQAAVEHLLRSLESGAELKQAIGLAHQLTVWLEERGDGAGDWLATRTALRSLLERMSVLIPACDASNRVELNIARGLLASPMLALSAADEIRHELDRARPRTQAEHKASALLCLVEAASPTRARPDDTVDALRRVLLDAQLCSEDPLDCHLWARTLLVLARAGHFEAADQFARHAQAMSQSRGLAPALAEYSLSLAVSLYMQGSLVESSENAQRALAVCGGRWWARRPEALGCLVASWLDQGRWEEAESVLSDWSGLEDDRSVFEGPTLLEQRGRLRGFQGRTAEALSDLLEAGSRADEAGVDSPAITIWRGEAAPLARKRRAAR